MNHIRTKTVSIRKPHRCFGCLREYPIHSKMSYAVYSDGGEISCSYLCMECLDFIDTLPHGELEEGFYEGDLLNYEEYREKIING